MPRQFIGAKGLLKIIAPDMMIATRRPISLTLKASGETKRTKLKLKRYSR